MKSITKNNIRTSFYPLWQQYNRYKAYLLRYPKSGNGFEAISRAKMIEYNKVRIHGAKPIFCYNPFVNLFFNIYGNAIACCRSHTNVLGTYPNQSIKDIWFGGKINKMREHMIHNDLNMGCEYCKLQIESNRFHSLPSIHSEKFATDKHDVFPQILELELSNTCNLQCVMCSGRVSSSIRKHRENLPPIVSPYDDAFVDQLEEFIPHLKMICFYGGEPFLIDLYYKILNLVIKINPAIKIYVVTNGTVFNQKIANLLQSVYFMLSVSIDSLKPELFSQIRVGAKLDEVIENFKKFQKLTNGNTIISHTPMRLNWDETPDIINFCTQHNVRVGLSYVEGPAKFALWSFMPDKLDEVYKFYQNVQFESTANHYTAIYNIQVFNEWKEQVKFFRDNNRNILLSYKDINQSFNNSLIQVQLFYKRLYEIIPNNCITYEQAMSVIDYLVIKKPRIPVHLDMLNNIVSDMEDIIKKGTVVKAKQVLKDTNSFTEYLQQYLNEDLFWAKYY